MYTVFCLVSVFISIALLDMLEKKLLTISSWNVQGYSHNGYNNFKDARFINQITKNDSICLMETHCDPSKVLELPDYKSVHLIRPKKISAGVSIYVKKILNLALNF